MKPPPARVRSGELRPGDVVVLAPGDTRQVHRAGPIESGFGIRVDWGDGRVSLLTHDRVLVRLHPPAPVPTPTDSDPQAPTQGDTQ